MKNYSMNEDEKKLFILDYEIAGGKIIIRFANNTKSIVPYTSDNEKRVLMTMENQAKNSDHFMNKQKIRKSVNIGTFSIALLYLILSISSGVGVLTLMGFISIILPSFVALLSTDNVIDSSLKIEDVRKSILFLKNKESLNTKINSNENVLINTKLNENDIKDEFSHVTINTIRNAKYKDLQQILENIERNGHFQFDYDTKNTKRKTYKR